MIISPLVDRRPCINLDVLSPSVERKKTVVKPSVFTGIVQEKDGWRWARWLNVVGKRVLGFKLSSRVGCFLVFEFL